MPLREFHDDAGREWQVWCTQPTIHGSNGPTALDQFMLNQPRRGGEQPVSVRARYVKGWLTFRSGRDRRRLVPVPENWESASEATLRGYLDGAEVVRDAAD